jgi:hypothetical protein
MNNPNQSALLAVCRVLGVGEENDMPTYHWTCKSQPGIHTTRVFGPLCLSAHFKGCNGVSIELSTDKGIGGYAPGHGFFAIGQGLKATGPSYLLARPRMLTLRLGRPIITLFLSRDAKRKYVGALQPYLA